MSFCAIATIEVDGDLESLSLLVGDCPQPAASQARFRRFNLGSTNQRGTASTEICQRTYLCGFLPVFKSKRPMSPFLPIDLCVPIDFFGFIYPILPCVNLPVNVLWTGVIAQNPTVYEMLAVLKFTES